MLTSAGSFRLDGVTVFRDVDSAAPRPAGPIGMAGPAGPVDRFTRRFFLLPDTPSLVVDENGVPEFDAVWYRGPAGTRRAGALVSLTVSLAVPADRLDVLRDQIRAALPIENLDEIELLAIPFIDGNVSLSVAGADPVTVPARLQGDQRATLVVELDADGAGELFTLLDRGDDLFAVEYDLTFGDRLTGVALRVWCDGRRAHDLAGAGTVPVDPKALTGTLIEEHSAGVELTGSQPVTPEHRAELEDLGRQLLAAGLRAALGRPYDSSVEATLNHTFTENSTVLRHAVSRGTIRLDRTTAELGDRVRVVELGAGFFASLDVAVVCTVDFATAPIEVVHVVVGYDATGSTGRVTRSADYTFRAGVGPQRFRTDLAGPELRAVSWRAEVFYRGDPRPVILAHPAVETSAIILDLDGTGVLTTEVSVRDPDWALTGAVTVDLTHPSTGHTGRLVLDRARPVDTWTQVVRVAPGPVTYRCTWHTPRGDHVEAEQTTTSRTIALEVPPALRSRTAVEVIAAGAFDDLAQLIVDLALTGGTDAAASFAFTAPGQQATWSDPQLRPGAERFRSRQTLMYADGRRDVLDWVDRDGPVLVVGDLLRCAVVVQPRLLDLGGRFRLALVELATGPGGAAGSGGAARDTPTATLVITDRSVPLHWAFRMPAPAASDYRYRLTLVPPSGDRIVGEWTPSRSTVLVLVPPAGSGPAAPDPVAPDPVAPDPVAPDPVAPDPAAPDPVGPDPVAPDPVGPDPVAPGQVEPVAPDPSPGSVTPDPAEPVAPDPDAPGPAAPSPLSPPSPSVSPDAEAPAAPAPPVPPAPPPTPSPGP